MAGLWGEQRARPQGDTELLGVSAEGTAAAECLEPVPSPRSGDFLFGLFFFSVITVEISPVHCIYVGVLLISFVPFSPRPPCLPPKPQKMRRPRPLSVYNHKLFNGNMETFIKVLAV